MGGERDFERRLALIERGVAEIEAAADAGLRATAQGLVQAVLELHATGLERLLEVVHRSGEAGQAIIDELGRDPQVGKLLILHSLHPLPLETRVEQAMAALAPLVASHRAAIERVHVADAVVRVDMVGGMELRTAIERALLDAAPDAAAIDVRGAADTAAVVGFVPIDLLRRADHRPGATHA